MAVGISPAVSGLLGGMTGGIAQAYATMGMYNCISRIRPLVAHVVRLWVLLERVCYKSCPRGS